MSRTSDGRSSLFNVRPVMVPALNWQRAARDQRERILGRDEFGVSPHRLLEALRATSARTRRGAAWACRDAARWGTHCSPRSSSSYVIPRAPSQSVRTSFQMPSGFANVNPRPPIARAISEMICQSGLDPPTGRNAARTRWMRRSAFMNVPSFSNDEQAGRKTVPHSRGFRQKHVLHDDELELPQCAKRLRGIRVRLQHVVANRPECLQSSGTGRVHHLQHVESTRDRQLHAPRASQA